MITYATLTQFRERLGIPEADSAEDARLLAALRQATAQIDRFTARRYAPVRQTRRFDAPKGAALRFDADLLELQALLNGDGTSIDPAEVLLLPGGDGAKFALTLAAGSGAAFTWTTSPQQAVQVTGIWGWHDNWPGAWRGSGDTVQDAPLLDTAAAITVSDADGSDAAHLAPRFQAGQLLRIGDEYAHVTAVDAAANTLTVIRGVRGTPAAEHAQGTAIEVYVPPLAIQALCLRWAAWLYQQVNAGIGTGADWLYPPDLPADLQRLASSYRRLRVA